MVEEYLADRLREADEVWTAFFARLGLPEPKVSYLIVTPESGPYKSNCGSLPVIHHEERKNALLTGYNGIPNRYPPGPPAACTGTYWKYA
ncbi:hypothetical protein ACF1G0_32390 [Streptomyces sp. NPDC013953]|uniref:hypothetical protein n=1 Tax=Streptomyces sp. NPDC013953 TaxID=3364868 RepID=UPI0037016856